MILWFLNRSKTVFSSNAIYKQQILKLKEKITNNNYPIQFFNDTIQKFYNTNRNRPKEKLKKSDFRNVIKVPYSQTMYGI